MANYYDIIEIRDFQGKNTIGYLGNLLFKEVNGTNTGCASINIVKSDKDALKFRNGGFSDIDIEHIRASNINMDFITLRSLSITRAMFEINGFGFKASLTSVIEYSSEGGNENET